MVRRPTIATQDEITAYKRRTAELEAEIERYESRILDEIQSEPAGDSLQSIVFDTTDVFTSNRGQPVDIMLVAECIHETHASDDETKEVLLVFTYAFHEYWNTFDDLFDDDIVSGAEPYVLFTNEVLNTSVFKYLQEIDNIPYWQDNIIRMITSFHSELYMDRTRDNYLGIIDKQSELFGVIAGVGARTGGADSSAVNEAEQFGKAYFKFEQLARDCIQYHGNQDGDPWNAWEVMMHDEIIEYVCERQTEVMAYVDRMPEQYRRLLTPIVGVDIEPWINHNC